ncbi:MAG: hypothetical protein AVDCRST_MAG41-213, partial [uncultured Corynebacteriales bacterium]
AAHSGRLLRARRRSGIPCAGCPALRGGAGLLLRRPARPRPGCGAVVLDDRRRPARPAATGVRPRARHRRPGPAAAAHRRPHRAGLAGPRSGAGLM